MTSAGASWPPAGLTVLLLDLLESDEIVHFASRIFIELFEVGDELLGFGRGVGADVSSGSTASVVGSSKKRLMESSKTWRMRKRVSRPTLYSPFSIRERSDCVTPIRPARSRASGQAATLPYLTEFCPTTIICERRTVAFIDTISALRLGSPGPLSSTSSGFASSSRLT